MQNMPKINNKDTNVFMFLMFLWMTYMGDFLWSAYVFCQQ